MNRTLKLSLRPNKSNQNNYYLQFQDDEQGQMLSQYKPSYNPP
jgi:hypothetical protein